MRELDHLKLARVIDACGGVSGRVKMQKIVYLLKKMGYDLPFDDFRIRQYGPYSRAVANATDMLTSIGIVEETGKDFESGRGGQAQQYSYRITDAARELIRRSFDVPSPAGKPAIDSIASELETKDRAVLEVAATKLFLERQEGREGEDLENELQRLKGHFQAHFTEANDLLSALGARAML